MGKASFLNVCKGVPDEINILKVALKEDVPHKSSWACSEQNGSGRVNSLSACLSQICLFCLPSDFRAPGSPILRLGLPHPSPLLCLQPANVQSWDFLAHITT